MSFVDFLKNFFRRKRKPNLNLLWGVDILSPDGGTQCIPVYGSGQNASSTDWGVGIQQVKQQCKMSKLIVEAGSAPGYMNVSLIKWINGQPIPGPAPSVTLTNGQKYAEVALGDVEVGQGLSFQPQVALSPNANSSPVINLKITLVLI